MGKVIKWKSGVVTVIRTFHPDRLAKDIDKILLAAENSIGKRINDAIQNNIDAGTDIKHKPFEKLNPKTLKNRAKKGQGSKILDITGKMRQTQFIPAKVPKQGWQIIAKTDYARVHNEGDSSRNIPKRQWFGLPKGYEIPNGKEWIKTKVLALKAIERAFAGYGFKSFKL